MSTNPDDEAAGSQPQTSGFDVLAARDAAEAGAREVGGGGYGQDSHQKPMGASLSPQDRVISSEQVREPEPTVPTLTTPVSSPERWLRARQTGDAAGGAASDTGPVSPRNKVTRWTRDAIETMSLRRLWRRRGRRTAPWAPTPIEYSLFQAPGVEPLAIPPGGVLDLSRGVTQIEYDAIVESTRDAIDHGVYPKRISAGSSGAYFAYGPDGTKVAVFKPKDEEPYGPFSPKWTKWLHRNLFPCFFGRSFLIPNNGYICEAAASALDRMLQTDIVPFTDTVFLSSSTFYYPYYLRRKFSACNAPPPKIGSYQLFLHDYTEANVFFRQYPLPGAGFPFLRRPGCSNGTTNGDDNPQFEWTEEVLAQFRRELEKLVILDYLMLNTDRGLDNWMIKVEWIKQDDRQVPHVRIGAIDSGLSFPWKHPDEWRSYPYGWLFLPLSLIGQPFSQESRDHFLKILCSKEWWMQAKIVLKQLFSRDTEFRERLWRRQWAVIKGQAFNIVETLKQKDQGPLELTRRPKMLVWDQEVEVPIAPETAPAPGPSTPGPQDSSTDFLSSPELSRRSTERGQRRSRRPKAVKRRQSSVGLASRYRQLQAEDDPNIFYGLISGADDGDDDYYDDAPLLGRRPSETGEVVGFEQCIEPGAQTHTVIVERLEYVTSREPVFTWC